MRQLFRQSDSSVCFPSCQERTIFSLSLGPTSFSFHLHICLYLSIYLPLSTRTGISSLELSSSALLSPCSHCSLGMPPLPILAESSSIHAPRVSVMNPQLFISPFVFPLCVGHDRWLGTSRALLPGAPDKGSSHRKMINQSVYTTGAWSAN